MRIKSDDGGYLEFQRSKKAHHVHVLVASRSPDNPLKLLVNSAEIPLSQLLQGVKSVTGPIRLDEGQENEKDNSENNPNDQDQKSEEQHTESGPAPVDRRR
jgi:hypothetical protein